MSSQVNTIVALSLRNPFCQKIMSSGLRRMARLRRRAPLAFLRWSDQPRHNQASHNKSDETKQEPLPGTGGDKVKPAQANAHPQQQAACEPKPGPFTRSALANGPPKTAKENRT
jgi:hypothetical protein